VRLHSVATLCAGTCLECCVRDESKKPPRNVHHVHRAFAFRSLSGERYSFITFTTCILFTRQWRSGS
jgi:hypothetical protein